MTQYPALPLFWLTLYSKNHEREFGAHQEKDEKKRDFFSGFPFSYLKNLPKYKQLKF